MSTPQTQQGIPYLTASDGEDERSATASAAATPRRPSTSRQRRRRSRRGHSYPSPRSDMALRRIRLNDRVRAAQSDGYTRQSYHPQPMTIWGRVQSLLVALSNHPFVRGTRVCMCASVMMTMAFILALVAGTLAYTFIYWALVPQASHVWSVHFQYPQGTPHESSRWLTANRFVASSKPQHEFDTAGVRPDKVDDDQSSSTSGGRYGFSSRVQFPATTFPLDMDEHTKPQAHMHIDTHFEPLPPLARGQPYDFELQLRVPDDEAVYSLGVFMVTLVLAPTREAAIFARTRLSDDSAQMLSDVTLKHSDGAVAVSRPGLARYSSWPIRTIRTLVKAVPCLLGLADETMVITVPLMRSVVDRAQSHAERWRWATVTIDEPRLSIYDAKLVASVNMRGLSYWMYHWYLSSFVLGSYITACIFLVIIVASALLCCKDAIFSLLGVRTGVRIEFLSDDEDEDNNDHDGVDPGQDGDQLYSDAVRDTPDEDNPFAAAADLDVDIDSDIAAAMAQGDVQHDQPGGQTREETVAQGTGASGDDARDAGGLRRRRTGQEDA